jgi:hypothetical protein
MALTCEAVAGRGLGWFVNWAAGMRVTAVPLMAGLVRTSTTSCGWLASLWSSLVSRAIWSCTAFSQDAYARWTTIWKPSWS